MVSDTDMYEVLPMKGYRTIAPQDLSLREKIGEGQFGDVHNGFLYPGVSDGCVCMYMCAHDEGVSVGGGDLLESLPCLS